MLHIVGDVSFADGYFDLGYGIGKMAKQGVDPLSSITLNKSDIWIGNLECVISDITEKFGQRADCFRLNEDVYLKNVSHLNIYAVANNHLMEHGNKAYNRTLEVISSESKYVGANNQKSLKFSHNDKKYGILVFSCRRDPNTKTPLYWYRPEYFEIVEEFNEIEDADFKIVYMHWGNEFISYPYMDQKNFAHWLIDIGFDLVVGCHSHVLQGYELYKGKYIYYSLGNFLFNMATPENRHSAILNLDYVDEEFKLTHDYVKIGSDCKPTIVSNEVFPLNFSFKALNLKIDIDDDNEQYYAKIKSNCSAFRKQNHINILRNVHKFPFAALLEVFRDYVNRRVKKNK